MVHWLEVLAALAEDPDSVPGIHIEAYNYLTPVSEDLHQAHMWYTKDTRRQNNIHIK